MTEDGVLVVKNRNNKKEINWDERLEKLKLFKESRDKNQIV